ncbi:hypothetical protein GCK32_019372 [Trichostrongylus colubriformis]|uniref:Uncharacterized protein n=1 Tax=Trichostrongylus colubriformis TaxID=6319 RepID=A0AAN8F3M5_TRICO
MRLAISTISLLAVTYAIPVIISEERINAILEKLRRAHAIGEFAVNTPTGIYPIKDINKDNLREIFNFAQAGTKDEEVDLEDHKAVPDGNLDGEPFTVEKDHSEMAATLKNKESKDKPSMDSMKAKATKTIKVKPAEEDKTKSSGATGSKLANAEKTKPSKTTEAPLAQADKEESTEMTEAPTTVTEKVQTTKAAAAPSEREVESEVTEKSAAEEEKDGTGANATATVLDKVSPSDAIEDRTLNATETAEIALEDTTAKDNNSTKNETSTGAEVSENHDPNEETVNEIVEATINEAHGANAVADSSSGDSSEVAVTKEAREEILTEKRMAHKSSDLASLKKSGAEAPAHVSKHDELEGSGELHDHDEVKESSGFPDDSPMPAADSTMLLTGNGSEPIDASLDVLASAGHVVIAKSSSHSLPTITIPQNPEEPYVFVPVQSYKGKQLPGVSYLLIPKKYENKVSDYLTSKTR